VLGLASGGGQQGPILAAAGANVTVLDQGQEVVKVRGPAAIVPEDEQRGLDTGGLDPLPEPQPLQAGC
jgi:hypothetical protein